jgi:hypothetical protein
VLGVAFLVLSFFGNLLVQVATMDRGTGEGLFALSQQQLVALTRMAAGACLLIAFATALVQRFHHLLEAHATLLKFVAFTLSSSALLLVLLTQLASEMRFYPLATILSAPQTLDVFGRRLLLVWPAQGLSLLMPRLSPRHIYYVIQAIVICTTVSLVGVWSARFVGWRNAYLGQMFLVAMLVPTFAYHNYYDIFIVATYTGALLCLHERKYWAFGLIAAICTLNHENTLLLVFVALAVCSKREPMWKAAVISGATLLAWFVVKVGISIAVPLQTSYHYRVITNLWKVANQPRAVLFSAIELSPMFLCTVFGWKSASGLLRRAAVFLIVPLFAVTYLFGQLDESRQFDAFIPVAIGFALSGLSRGKRKSGGNRDIAATVRTTDFEPVNIAREAYPTPSLVSLQQ